MLHQFYTDGRQFTITGKPVQLNETFRTGRYDLVVEEAPWSPNQKMETAIKLKEVIGLALQARVPIPPDIISFMDLPETLTEKWQALLENAQEQPQQDPRIEIGEGQTTTGG